jgi:hypothetical protein
MSDLRRGAVVAPAPPAASAAPGTGTAGGWPGLARDVALVFAASLALYAALAAPSVLFGDSAELQAVALRGGIPHPSGYPAFVLIGRVFARVPFPDPAYRITFMAAFFAAATVALLVRTIAELGSRAARRSRARWCWARASRSGRWRSAPRSTRSRSSSASSRCGARWSRCAARACAPRCSRACSRASRSAGT